MPSAKDLTTTSFGLVVAYLLPGLFAFYTWSFWSTTIRDQLDAFSSAQSNVGLFLLVVLVALLLGVQLTAFRWFIFERILCRRHRLRPEEFIQLRTQDRIAAFSVAVDENFRYHQFWGGIAPVMPIFFVGLARIEGVSLWSLEGLVWAIVFVFVEGVTVAVAIEAFKRYVERARAILREA